MTVQALVMMLVVWAIVTFFAGYFMYRVLSSPQRPSQDDRQ